MKAACRYSRGWSMLVLVLLLAAPVSADRDAIAFVDVAAEAGITYVGASWGSAWGDFNSDGLPDVWLVCHWNEPRLYINQGDGTFIEIVHDVLADDYLWVDAHGAIWGDFDNDGDQDLYQLADGGDTPHPAFLFVNEDGQFVERGVALGVDYLLGRGRMPCWLDFDRDGYLDILHPTLRRAPDWPSALFRQGPTGFTEVADEMGLVPNDIKACSFNQIADLNGDGIVDLVRHLGGYPDKVYDMTTEPFTPVQDEIGLAKVAVVVDGLVADLDNDLDNDLFMVRGHMPYGFEQYDDFLLEAHINLTDGTERGFSFVSTGDVTIDIYPQWVWAPAEIYIGAAGGHPESLLFTLSSEDPTVWGMYDHEPGVDSGLYIGHDPETNVWQVLRSERLTNFRITCTDPITDLTAIGWSPEELPLTDAFIVNVENGFVDRTFSSGFEVPSSATNVVAGDFDNDMDQDVYIVATGPVANRPNLIYLNDGGGNFSLLPDAGGAAGNSLGRGDAVTAVDYDGNGFLDLLVTNGKSKAPFDADGSTNLFKNLGNDNHWLEIDLVGVLSNRDGIGARLEATAGGVTQLREQNGGVHYRSQNHQRVHFGLGSHTVVEELSIRWPSGIEQVLHDIPADQILQVTENVASNVEDPDRTPARPRLIGCYPNPFNPATTISFALPSAQPVTLRIYDALGRLVQVLVEEQTLPAGVNEVVWNGQDRRGKQVPSGVYLYTLQAGSYEDTQRMVMIK